MEYTQNKAGRKPVPFFRSIGFFLREYFFPSAGCAVCGLNLTGKTESWYGLCEECRDRLDAVLADSCRDSCDRCGRPLISEQSRCLSCRGSDAPAFDRLITLFPYDGSLRKLLQAYKFEKNLALGNYFAEKTAEAIGQLSLSAAGCVLTPVPPRPGKIKKTGWDQVDYLAGLLERGRAGTQKFPVLRCLRRLKSGVQKKLNREARQKNLRDRIVLKKKPSPAVVIIDDVITTGSTMDVCAAVLKSGGAEMVYGVCLFYD